MPLPSGDLLSRSDPDLQDGELYLPDESATRRAGFILGEILRSLGSLGSPDLLVTLNGELGAGKTTFCQGAGEALNVPPGEVKSPTFSLAHKHRGAVNFSHLDLFRLKDNDVGEFLEAGLDEYLAGLCFVEWAERLPGDFWPEERLELGFFSLKSGGRLLKGRGVTLGTQAIWSQVTGKFKLMECSHANHPEIRR